MPQCLVDVWVAALLVRERLVLGTDDEDRWVLDALGGLGAQVWEGQQAREARPRERLCEYGHPRSEGFGNFVGESGFMEMNCGAVCTHHELGGAER